MREKKIDGKKLNQYKYYYDNRVLTEHNPPDSKYTHHILTDRDMSKVCKNIV